jgi:ABC-type lipoprotein export system ATPase subunit
MLSFDQLVPIPLSDQDLAQSDIWAAQCQIRHGKRYFVTAPSGKGKTTLQHIIYGLRKDYKGTVELTLKTGEVKSIHLLTAKEWAAVRREQFSVVFQDLRLFPDLTALENLQLKNSLTGHKTISELEEMAKKLDVYSLLQKPCGQLSYGQRQRFAIIRALCQPFQLLWLDEPFAHLDSGNMAKCCQLIEAECTAQGATLLITSLEERYNFTYTDDLVL